MRFSAQVRRWLPALLLVFCSPFGAVAQSGSLSDLDSLRYIASHSDLIQAFGADAQKGREHYQNNGLKEGRKITFETWRYMASHSDVIQAFGLDPIAGTRHYITNGYREARKVDFESYRYIASHSDLISAFGLDPEAGARHYVGWGYREGRKITFPAYQYLASYPDLMDAFGDDTEAASRHYIGWGVKEGRRVSFDGYRYIASHPDLITAFGDDPEKAARHYVTAGRREGRGITFDIWRYIASYSDLIVAFGNDLVAAARHYITSGYREGRTLLFDSLAYIASYSDLIQAFGTDAIAGARHYVESGYREGRQILFDAAGYLFKNPDLDAVYGGDTAAATKHYINVGFSAGRDYSLTVTVKVVGSGSASVSKVYLSRGQQTSVSFSPGSDSYLASVTGCSGVLNRNTYTTSAISSGCEIIATFKSADGEIFSNQPVAFPDIYSKFKDLCDPDGKGLVNSSMNINSAVVANMAGHKDGRRDLVVGLWCQPTVGTVVNGPTLGGLIVFIQKTDGTFFDATKQMFGVDILEIGGRVPFRAVAKDLNKDGYDEVFFAVTGEDGRTLPEGFTGYNRQNFVLTSTSSGSYRQTLIGWPSYNYLAKLVVRASGTFDVLTDTIGYGGKKQAFRLIDQSWQSVSDYDDVPGFDYSFMSSGGLDSAVDIAIGNAGSGADREMVLYTRNKTNGRWALEDRLSLGVVQKADVNTWNGDPGTLDIYKFGGVDYGFVQFQDNCVVADPTSPTFSLFSVSAQKIVGGYTPGRRLTESDPKDFQWSLLMLGYEVQGGRLVERKVSFNNFIENKKFYTLTCDDLSGDGKTDLVISNWGTGEKPDLYLNLGSARFGLISPERVPPSDTGFEGAHALYEDVNGDGHRDLLYVARAPAPGVASMRFQMFLGTRGLFPSDLK